MQYLVKYRDDDPDGQFTQVMDGEHLARFMRALTERVEQYPDASAPFELFVDFAD
jgi:hypothetical protein